MSKNPNMNPNLPKIQIPIGVNKPGLTVDGEFTHYIDLPEDAKEAYDRFVEHKNRVYQCENCGYLTMSERTNKYKGYKCGNCGNRDFKLVYGGVVADDAIDPSDLDPKNFPNTKSHLTRIKNEIEKSISQREMLYRVAEAVKRHRDPFRRAVDEASRRSEELESSQATLEEFAERKGRA